MARLISSSVSDSSITASIGYNDQTYTFGWKDVATFQKYFSIQNAQLVQRDFTPGLDKCTESVVINPDKWITKLPDIGFESVLLNKWYDISTIIDLPANAKVINIGCGCSVSNLFLAQHNPTAMFWLYDKEGWYYNPDVLYMENSPYHHHAWSVVEDGIKNSGGGLDRSRFTLCSPTDPFPSDVDLIYSIGALGFHHGIHVNDYLNRITNSLKVGGVLLLDIILTHDFNIEDAIAEAMNSEKLWDRPLMRAEDDNGVTHTNVTHTPGTSRSSGLPGYSSHQQVGYRAKWIKK